MSISQNRIVFTVALAGWFALCGLVQAARAESMVFRAGCTHGERLRVALVGDLLFHKLLQLQAYRKGSDFTRFFGPMKDVLAGADLLYGNLEGPAAHGVAIGGRAVRDPGRRLDGRVYSAVLKTLSFNYHPSVIDDLKAVGFDVVSTANNHALDRGALGAKRTIENLDARGMAFTGTRDYDIEGPDRTWHVVTQKNGFRIAWLACTFSTNGFPDRREQVLYCYKDQASLLDEIRGLAQSKDIDAVILTPHWGVEGSHLPLKRQRILARAAIEAGAAAVVGTHPHVIQPWEKYVSIDGREGIIVYSTGNFVSNQRRLMERSGVLTVLEFTKNLQTHKVTLSAAGYIPTWVVIDGKGHRVTANNGRGWARDALRQTGRMLPVGNQLDRGWPPKLARDCPLEQASAP